MLFRKGEGYVKGVHENPGFACAAKHFPGNGQDFRDAHLSNNVNYFDVEEWDKTYGLVYKTLIENDLDAIMAGHIMLPKYAKAINPELKDEDMMPATLSPEIMKGLLRDKLGFNGMVVTDASHMVGMTDRMKRKDMLPRTINAGCDMFLFFNDPEEDFATMLEAYQNGTISEERMEEALERILGLKAHLGLHKKAKEALVPAPEALEGVLGSQEHKDMQKAISRDSITLVKYKDKEVLPVVPERYKRIKLMYIGSEAVVIAGTKFKSNDENIIKDIVSQLEEAGFEVDAEVPSAKGKMEDFKKKYDCVLLILNVQGFAQFNTMRVKWDEPTKQPWYMSELPTFVVSLSYTNNLIDVPMARCYINSYMDHHESFAATLEKMMGKSEFKGRYNENVFCGRWETRF